MKQVDHIICIHGHGSSGDKVRDWLERGLNDALTLYGFTPLSVSDPRIVTPSYFDLLSAKVPTDTEPPPFRQATRNRQWYERRAAYRERMRHLAELVGSPASGGFEGRVSKIIPRDAGAAIAKKIRFREVERYCENAYFRHAVQRRVYDGLPREGRALVFAHSLGSVVALDLLNVLPSGLRVDLLVTLGSPVAHSSLRQFLMGKGYPWPYDRIDGWLNVFDLADFITGGNGLGALDEYKSVVVDAQVDNGPGNAHNAHRHLANAVCARILGPLVTKATPYKKGRMGDVEAGAQLIDVYSRRVAAEVPFADARRQRMHRTININNHVASDMPKDKARVRAAGVDLRKLGARFDEEGALARLVELFFSNPFLPFDIEVERIWQWDALRFIAKDLGRPKEWVDEISRLAPEAVKVHQKRPWGKVLVGTGLVATAVVLPFAAVGLAATSGLVGAAALTSGLAALGGSGGMVGGLWILGAASTVAGSTGAAVLARLSQEQLETELAKLQVVAVLERRLGMRDEGKTEIEALRELARQASAWIEKHEQVDGKSHRNTKEWRQRKTALTKAITWIETRDDSSKTENLA